MIWEAREPAGELIGMLFSNRFSQFAIFQDVDPFSSDSSGPLGLDTETVMDVGGQRNASSL